MPTIGSTPPAGTVVKVVKKSTSVVGARVSVVTDWENRIKFDGRFSYSPYANPSDPTTPPGPSSIYRYSNNPYKRTRGLNQPFSPASRSAWPGGALPQYFWSAKTPSQLYGYVTPPSTPTGDPNDRAVLPQDTGSGSTTVGNPTQRLKGPIVTNPPPHAFTKGTTIPFERGGAKSKLDRGRLGIIYAPDVVVSTGGNAYTKKWGFRFMYIPTYWGYSLSADESRTTPEQMANSVGEQLVPGNARWSIEVYINRIADMHAGNQKKSYYSGKVSGAALKELWKRGTEYDIDYLFRVINGDAKRTRLNGKTANIGFLQKAKVRVQLADGIKFDAMVESVDVQHVMMNHFLVPTLSKVTIGLTQFIQDYPVKK